MLSDRLSLRLVVSAGVVLLGGLALVACSADTATSPLPVIVSAQEPGPRLTVEGRVIDAASGEPVEGARVVVYQTDQAGTYQNEDPDDESTARIRGELITDRNGEFGFVTVQPGEYPDQPPGNRHIHFHSVTAEGFAPKGFVLLFDDNVRPDVREWAESTGFGIVVPVTGDPNSGLSTTLEIPLDSDT